MSAEAPLGTDRPARTDFASLIEGFNAGEPIPPVDPNDLSAALGLFTVLRAHAAGVGLPDRGYSFMRHDLAERCSPGADAVAASVRGFVLDAVLQRTAQGEQPDEQSVIRAIATVPLHAADLADLDRIRRRAFE
jgi:hypothetical protein